MSNSENSIIQPWAAALGLRYQGLLMAAVRGCDSEPREGAHKWLVRYYRACVLRAHCGDPARAASFMVWPEAPGQFMGFAREYLSDWDHLPLHFVLHFLHAAEVVGYHHPRLDVAGDWQWFYYAMVRKLHLNPETKDGLRARLSADESTFAQQQEI